MASSSSSSSAPRPPPGYSFIPATPASILLPLTISNKCGQSFRWRSVRVPRWQEEEEKPALDVEDDNSMDTEYSICLSDRVVFLRQDASRGYLYHRTLAPDPQAASTSSSLATSTAAWLHSYLSLTVPLESLYSEWSARDPVFAKTAPRFKGIRMLRQDPWETLCAFICSSNNNIARIGGMVQNLCSHYSPKLLSHEYEGVGEDPDVRMTVDYHPFPSPASLAGKGVEAHLRQIGFGYRARYIAETARMLCDAHGGVEVNDALFNSVAEALKGEQATVKGDTPSPSSTVYTHLLSLRTLSYTAAREALLPHPGIGPKVADCILLMSLDQPASIPVDRHVFQFAAKQYGLRGKKAAKYEDLADFFRELWGEWAGWAHSVLFMADLRAFQDYGNGVKKEEKKEEGLEVKIDGAEEGQEEAKEPAQSEESVKRAERAAKRGAMALTTPSSAMKKNRRASGKGADKRLDETYDGVKVSPTSNGVKIKAEDSRGSSVENHLNASLRDE
ncbi:DNA glycosylase [Jaminaea rosea]|uniref:DNA-(apurinic or apyrimidinic site) lyase n=1 Tax=Jaminaea rosea TaxID=1569628 RepID=A0A316UMT4_9BASI|nr:DNA glycosylase [Jaminaea rosea]PWN26569.1 DNA glycosylase [Jaminaea rosea]